MHRSKKTLTYHGRSGHPYIHKSDSGRSYIMVRAVGGGTKRLYLVHGNVPKGLRKKHRRS